jgi:arylsulfatase A-like enzyme
MRHIDGHEHYPVEIPYFKEKAEKRGPLKVWENRKDVTAGLDKCHTTDLFTARAKKWIIEQRRQSPSQPFFLYLAYDTPHAVLELPTQSYPAGGGLKGGIQWLGTPGCAINTAGGKPDSWMHPDYKTRKWPDVYKRHATSVRRIDDAVGDLLQLLKDLDMDGNTLVVFTSDNGPSAESFLPEKYHPSFFASYGPYDGIKRDCWEGGMRVPTITRWPGHIPASLVINTPSAFWDWMPTFANLSGLPAPARTDGISLVPILTGSDGVPGAGNRAFYFEYEFNGHTPNYTDFELGRRGRMRGQMQAIRLGDMMGVRYDIKSHADDFEIYNVVTDPKETTNLAGASPALQAAMKARVLQMRVTSTPAPRPYDNEFVPALDARALPAAFTQGLDYNFYAGSFPWVPDIATLTPASTGHAATIDAAPLEPATSGALHYTGYMEVPADGEYTFHVLANSGATLRIHDATVLDADYGYQGDSERTGTIKLKAGLHPLKLTYYYQASRSDPPRLMLLWSSDKLAKQPMRGPALKSPAKAVEN